jgi:glucokinase
MRVGLDVGGTKTHGVVMDGAGDVRAEVRMPTGFGPAEVLATVERAVRALATQSGLAPDDFASVGIGIPGTVDPVSGRVAHSVNLGIVDLSVARALSGTIRSPLRLENDVNAAALGVFHHRGGSAGGSLAYLNVGTGLAAGLVLGGALWRGSRGTAGEIGHIPVDPGGELCRCGQVGCLETIASGSAIARLWPTRDPWPVRALFAAAEGGEPAAVVVRDGVVHQLAAAVRMLALTVDADVIVIGGGVSTLGGGLLEPIRRVLDGWAGQSPFLASQDLARRLELAPSDYPAAAVGAALVGASTGT